MNDKHSLHRTSPKGEGATFIGTCIKCGKPGLTVVSMTETCENTYELTNDEVMTLALRGPNIN